jgi:hypothetical protein
MNEATNEALAVEPQASPEVEVTEEMIRELAAQADGIPYKPSGKANTEAGQTPVQPTEDASRQPQSAEAGNKDSDESAAKDDKISDSDKDKPSTSEASEVEEKPEETKPEERKETKKAKEEARLAESWKRLEAEKASVRAKQAELDRKLEEADRSNDPTTPANPDKLRQYAKEWENEGRDDLARAARQQADLLEQKAKIHAEKAQKANHDFNERWSSSVTRMISENPELKDDQSDLGRRVISILRSGDEDLKNLINSTPNGFIYATQIAKMQKAAEESEVLRTELESLKKENADLRKKTSLSASGSQAPAKRKNFEEMSYQEQEEFLRRNASDADRFGVLIGE